MWRTFTSTTYITEKDKSLIAEKLPVYEIKEGIKEIEFDEMIAWVTGSRFAKTFRRLYDKVKRLKNCTFYTDSWDAFAKVLPKDRHFIGKQYTAPIERDDSNIRNDLARFTRRTKVTSKSQNMIYNTLKLWQSLWFAVFNLICFSVRTPKKTYGEAEGQQ